MTYNYKEFLMNGAKIKAREDVVKFSMAYILTRDFEDPSTAHHGDDLEMAEDALEEAIKNYANLLLTEET